MTLVAAEIVPRSNVDKGGAGGEGEGEYAAASEVMRRPEVMSARKYRSLV